MLRTLFLLFIIFAAAQAFSKFSFNPTTFLLDDQPFTIRSGEMHYARIPPEYWSHRMKMAKAMSLNTIATYVFWNFHEQSKGTFDFESPKHDLAKFIQLAKEEVYMFF